MKDLPGGLALAAASPPATMIPAAHGCPRGHMLLRVTRDQEGSEDHVVETKDISSWRAVMPTLFQAAPVSDYAWFYPTPKGVVDAWAPLVLGDGHRLSLEEWCQKWRAISKRELKLALEDDWKHVVESWDHGCKSRYRARARQCGTELAERLDSCEDVEAALNSCWEFAHEPSNARACGALSRRVVARIASVDPKIRVAACRAAWRLCEADEGICRELIRRDLAGALVGAVERRCDVALGCLVALAHRDAGVRRDLLASPRGLRALVTAAARSRSRLALGGLLFGLTAANGDARRQLCLASDLAEAVAEPEELPTDAPAPEDVASAPAPAATAKAGALAALAPLLAAGDLADAKLAAACLGVLTASVQGTYPGATRAVDACAVLVDRALDGEDFDTARVAARAADACATLPAADGPDLNRLLDLTHRCVNLPRAKQTARAVASCHARCIGRCDDRASVEAWILMLGELLPHLDEGVTAALPLAVSTPNGRDAALRPLCFRVLCDILQGPYTTRILEPVACALELLSRERYDPCSLVLEPNAWHDASHVGPFLDSFAIVGKAFRDNAERRVVVGFGAVVLARLARAWAAACARKGRCPRASPLLKRKCLGTLCAVTKLLVVGGLDAVSCAAITALRVLMLGAASLTRDAVKDLLERGAVEKAVLAVLKRPEEDSESIQAKREVLELVWKLTKSREVDEEACRIDARGFGPALVAPLCALMNTHAARDAAQDHQELAAGACRVLLRLCCESAAHARALETKGSDVVQEVLRCLSPGRNALVQETALFTVQLLAARDRRLGVQLAQKGASRIAALLHATHPHAVRKGALHALLNLSVAKDACWPVARKALEGALAASTEASDLRTYAVSLLANLSRDARVCYAIHLRKLRVDYGNCERAKLAKLERPPSTTSEATRAKLDTYDTLRSLFEDAVDEVSVVDAPVLDASLAEAARVSARRHLAAAPNSLWVAKKPVNTTTFCAASPNSLWINKNPVDTTIRKVLADAARAERAHARPWTAPPKLADALRAGSFRVGPATDNNGVSPWNPHVARGAAASRLGKRCVLQPGGARNTFRFPPGLATGGGGETRLCCFKSCVGAKLYTGECPTFFLPRKKDEELDDVLDAELDAPDASEASKALRSMPSFAQAVGKLRALVQDDDASVATEYTAYHLFRTTRVACEVLHPGTWRDGSVPPGWTPDDHLDEFEKTYSAPPPSAAQVPAPFPPHAPTVTKHHMVELEHAPLGSWGRLAPAPLCLFCTRRPIVVESIPEEPPSTWTLDASIWAPRKLEADARDYYDTPRVTHRGFRKDWAYLTDMPRFPNFAKRLSGYRMSDPRDAPASVVEALQHGAEVLYGALLPILKHYASTDLASNNPFDLNMTDWVRFLRETDCFDDDAESPTHFTPEAAQIVFRQCKVEIGVSPAMRRVNDGEHLCRYEFLDAVLRVVEAKYDLDHAPPDSHSREDHILESVERFRDEHLSKLPAAAHECVDAFRRDTLYCEEVDIVLCRHDRLLKQIWAAYGNAHRKAGHARFTADVFGEFLTKCLLCHSADAIQAARRSFAFGRTFFVDTCDAGFRELTYVSFLEALCRFVHVEVEVPTFVHLREVSATELTEFYETLYLRSTKGDAVHAINELRRFLAPDRDLSLADRLALVLPAALAGFSVSCGGDFVTKLDHVRLTSALSAAQKAKWVKRACHISRGDCEHVLARDQLAAAAHAVDKKDMFAEVVQREEAGAAGVW